jgi:Ca-activated chloride channel family protein
MLKAEDFNDDKKDAGEIGAGHTVTALYETVPTDVQKDMPKVDKLRYQTRRDLTAEAQSNELLTVKLRYKQPDGDTSKLISGTVLDRHNNIRQSSDNHRHAAAVAAFGMLLRDSEHKGQASFEMVRSLAESARGRDPHGYRAEFLELVQKAEKLQ